MSNSNTNLFAPINLNVFNTCSQIVEFFFYICEEGDNISSFKDILRQALLSKNVSKEGRLLLVHTYNLNFGLTSFNIIQPDDF